MKTKKKTELVFKGIPVSEGFAFGTIYNFDSQGVPIPSSSVSASKIEAEILRFENALIASKQELLTLQDSMHLDLGPNLAKIFNAHIQLIDDKTVFKEVSLRIKKEKKNASFVFDSVMTHFMEAFLKVDDPYLRERVLDIQDVTRRVLQKLHGKPKKQTLEKLKKEVILLAYDLAPSETATMHQYRIAGLAIDIGGKTSHTAILAQSMAIPAVLGLGNVSRILPSETPIILDGTLGILIAHPKKETLLRYEKQKTFIEGYQKKLNKLKRREAVTQDGHVIELYANIKMPEDLEALSSSGASGVGLYRTEFCYMNRPDLPSEEELLEHYAYVVKNMAPRPVTIRTLDVGGDKFLCNLNLPEELNPFLGWRGIRFCLARKDVFKTQMRAILRASAFGPTKIMYPMISNVSELILANLLLEVCMCELKNEGLLFDKHIKIGAMVEVPSTAIITDLIIPHVHFLSIGTNDLIQYTLAVDRINEKIAYLYQPFHPAVLRLIASVLEVAKKKNVEVSLCGEMATDPAAALLLVGMGIQNFSLSPLSIPKIKDAIRKIKHSSVKQLVKKIKSCSNAEDIRSQISPLLEKIIPHYME